MRPGPEATLSVGVCTAVVVVGVWMAVWPTGQPLPAFREPIDAATPDPYVRDADPVAAPRPTRASREKRASMWDRYPSWVRDFARCVIAHESANAGLYRAENPTSTASGAYQFVDGTFTHYARQLGYRWTHASDAPPAVQDHVFAHAAMDSKAHWNGTNC